MYILENIFGNGFKQTSLTFITIISIISGVLVITSKNPVTSVLFLIGLFLTIAIHLFMLNIPFIALAYLLVYVGAVTILFLFILMLINIRVSELSTDNSNSIPLSIIIITIFSLTLSHKSLISAGKKKLALLSNSYLNNKEEIELIKENDSITSEGFFTNLFFVNETNDRVSLAFYCAWDNILAEMSDITTIGNLLYVSYSVGIILVGLILLLSMIGAISVTATSSSKN